MKKLFIPLVLFSFTFTALKAQKEVLFKMGYLPSNTYSSTMNMDMNMEMDITGDTAIVNKMKKSGQKLPMIMQMQSTMGFDIKTGVQKDSKIPVIIRMGGTSVKMKMNGVESPIPSTNTKTDIYGYYSADGKMSIDSVGGKKMDDALKQQMVKMIDQMQANIKFPDKPMKIGDTFPQDIPMDLPMAGGSAKVLVKGIYKLIAIENNKAYFDVTFTMTMDMTENKMNVDMTGGGDGKFIYDMTNNFVSMVRENLNMIYSLALPQMPPKMKMTGKANMLMDQKTTVTAN